MPALMRAAAAALALAALAGATQAQPRGYYPDPWSAAYAYRYEPPIAYGPEGRYTPYVYPNGYDGFHTVIPESAERLSGTQEHDADGPSAAAALDATEYRRVHGSSLRESGMTKGGRPSAAGEPSH